MSPPGNSSSRRLAGPPNPSFHPTCYGWLRQPAHAGELKRWTKPPEGGELRRVGDLRLMAM